MIIIFLGPPGAGKGTQAKLLGQKLGLSVISVGHLLREAYQRGVPEGIKAWRDFSSKGLNVPIGLKFKLMKAKMDRADKGFILDNFPRTEEDLRVLAQYLQEKNKKVDHVFHLMLSEEVAISRVLTRKGKGKVNGIARGDDDLEILRVRIKEGYHQDLSTILDHFRRLGVLEELDGEKEEEVVHREILVKLGLE